MEHLVVIIIVALALAGFVKKILVIYREGNCGCGCENCGHADNGCSEFSRQPAELIAENEVKG
jgi:hypothetical protein